MKIRSGFVSNSSSSSFILISKEDIERFGDQTQIFKVSDLIEKYRPTVEVYTKMISSEWDSNAPWFENEAFSGSYFPLKEYYDSLVEIEEKFPGCFITNPYDRDRAYEKDFSFPVFESDL